MSTMIGASGPSAAAYNENGERKYRNKKYLTSAQRTLVTEFKEIAEMAEKLNSARPVVEAGQMIFKKIQTKHSLKGRSNEAIAAACLYLSYRQNGVPRTFKEICAVAKAKKRDIAKCFKIISGIIEGVISQASVSDYIPRFCAHLCLPIRVENEARKLLERFDEKCLLSGRNPSTVAALAIMMAVDGLQWMPDGSKERFIYGYMAKKISEITGAAESTIRDAHSVVRAEGGPEFAMYFQPGSALKRGNSGDQQNKMNRRRSSNLQLDSQPRVLFVNNPQVFPQQQVQYFPHPVDDSYLKF